MQTETDVQDNEKTFSLDLIQDSDAENPRTAWDNLGTMVCSHRRYSLGDEDGLSKATDRVRTHFSDTFLDDWDLSVPGNVYELLQKSEQAIILPLYLYDHSGITMKTTPFSCPWDSGQVGYIFVSKEQVRNEYGWKRLTKQRVSKIESYLKGEVSTYDQFLTGDIWGFRAMEDDDEVDSCWGFYGDDPRTNGMLDYLSEPFQALAKAGTFEHRYR